MKASVQELICHKLIQSNAGDFEDEIWEHEANPTIEGQWRLEENCC